MKEQTVRCEGKRWEEKSSIQMIMNFKLVFSRPAGTDLIGYGKEHIDLKLISFLSKL